MIYQFFNRRASARRCANNRDYSREPTLISSVLGLSTGVPEVRGPVERSLFDNGLLVFALDLNVAEFLDVFESFMVHV